MNNKDLRVAPLIAMTPSTNHSLWLTNSHPHPHPRTTTTRAERALSSQFLRVSQFSMDTVVFCYNTGVLRAQYWSIVDLNTEVLAHTYSRLDLDTEVSAPL